MTLQLEFPFTLPIGYTDAQGRRHQDGVMRLATAYDEIAPMKDPRVQVNPGYLVIILLSRVITRLGDLSEINPKVIEGLFAGDLAFLQDLYRRINENGHDRLAVMDLYRRINENGHDRLAVTCPQCDKAFEVEVGSVGG